MTILSAREMFKAEEKLHGSKSYWKGEQAVRKYGKINRNIAFRLIERTKWIGNNSKYDVEVLTLKEDRTYDRTGKSFWDETEPSGGRIVGKRYKDALEFANEYINNLKLSGGNINE